MKMLKEPNRDAMFAYFQAIAGKKTLSEKESTDLFRIMNDNGEIKNESGEQITVAQREKARQQLIEGNLRLVVFLAKRYCRSGLDFEDVIAEGNIGLMRAVKAFKPEIGVKFAFYASYWIRAAIRMGIARMVRCVNIPVNLMHRLLAYQRITLQIQGESGEKPSRSVIASRMGISESRVRSMEAAWRVADRFCHGTEASEAMHSLIGRERNPQQDAISREAEEHVETILDKLPSRYSRVLRLRNGLTPDGELTLDEIAVLEGVSRERVRQVQAQAMQTAKFVGRGVSTERAVAMTLRLIRNKKAGRI